MSGAEGQNIRDIRDIRGSLRFYGRQATRMRAGRSTTDFRITRMETDMDDERRQVWGLLAAHPGHYHA